MSAELIEKSHSTQLRAYDSYYFSLSLDESPPLLKLFKKNMDLQWELDRTPYKIDTLQPHFNQFFLLDSKKQIHAFELTNKLHTPIKAPNTYKKFIVQHPHILTLDTANTLAYQPIEEKETYWKKTLPCKDMMLSASGTLIGCITEKNLYLYESISGKKELRHPLKKGNWKFESSWNRGIILSNNNSFHRVSLENHTLTPITLKNKTLIAWLRQKEALLYTKNDHALSCIDIESNEARWLTVYEKPITNVIAEDHFILVSFPENEFRVLDDFTGNTVFSFKHEDAKFQPTAFHLYQNHWYFFDKTLVLKLEHKDHEETTD